MKTRFAIACLAVLCLAACLCQEGILEALKGSAIGKAVGSLVAKADIGNALPTEKDPCELGSFEPQRSAGGAEDEKKNLVSWQLTRDFM